MLIIFIFGLISLILLIFSFFKKKRNIVILNFINLAITLVYANFDNVLENRFNESFNQNNLINPEKFYSYLGLQQTSIFLMIIIVQIWFFNLWFWIKSIKN
jgi:hypothetical protein